MRTAFGENTMQNDRLEQDIAELPVQPITALKDLWLSYFNEPAPKFNKVTLVNKLAYRMQELAYGGLSSDTRNLLRDLADGRKPAPKRKARERLAIGTRLIRIHNGVEHRVTVLAKGYEYNGRVYRTLSGVAKGITGTVWNGYIFFGLKKGDAPKVVS